MATDEGPQKSNHPILQATRTALVLTIVIGLIRLMATISFAWILVQAYLLFFLLACELLLDPKIKWQWLRWLLTVVTVGCAIWFSIAVTFAKAPLKLVSYAMRNGDYAEGTKVAGIEWDSHFTDLRVSVTNASADDFQDLDLMIRPDEWTYQAAILDDVSSCHLNPAAGKEPRFVSYTVNKESRSDILTVTKPPGESGGEADVHDKLGNTYAVLARDEPYRLICNKIPSGVTIRIVFAVVTLGPFLLTHANQPTSPGNTRINIGELAGGKSKFELLDSRPFPVEVYVTGRYLNQLRKPYAVNATVTVGDGS